MSLNITTDALLVFSLATIVSLLLAIQSYRIRRTPTTTIRAHPGYDHLQEQVGLAIESGRQLHISLGRAGLADPHLPASIAAQHILSHLGDDSCASGIPPTVTVGEPTLLMLGQESVQASYYKADKADKYLTTAVQFVANDHSPYAYAAGTVETVQHSNAGSNVLVGHFGAELVLMAEAGERLSLPQVIGSDDPTAIAVATAYVHPSQILMGEELLAAEAYIEKTPSSLASLQVQNSLRLVVIVTMLAAAGLHFVDINLLDFLP